MGYSLRVNHKKLSTDHFPDRNDEFLYLTDLRQRFQRRAILIISVDARKRELIGAFKNPGSRWDPSPRLVNDHDFRSDATGIAIPHARLILILSDTGGSNGCRCRAWKTELQAQLANCFGLTLTVVHYPTGASKWNPIERRLFSEIPKNWAGEPLDSNRNILPFIRSTKTQTGLSVTAHFDGRLYLTVTEPTPKQLQALRIRPHEVLPTWNYSFSPNL